MGSGYSFGKCIYSIIIDVDWGVCLFFILSFIYFVEEVSFISYVEIK